MDNGSHEKTTTLPNVVEVVRQAIEGWHLSINSGVDIDESGAGFSLDASVFRDDDEWRGPGARGEEAAWSRKELPPDLSTEGDSFNWRRLVSDKPAKAIGAVIRRPKRGRGGHEPWAARRG